MNSAKSPATIAALAKLLDASNRPIYAVDADREIVFCNAALTNWLGLERRDVVGRYVEYHSEPTTNGPKRGPAPLADLCPPPEAMAGRDCLGTVSSVARDGRLMHRRAEFVPLLSEMPRQQHENSVRRAPARCGVLVLLASSDLSPEELSAQLSPEPSGDELHRAIRRFRRGQAAEYAIESLLGGSSSMRKVRAQVVAAAAGQANVMIRGPRGSGRSTVARAVHFQTTRDGAARLIPVECDVATEESLRSALDLLRQPGDTKRRGTLLFANLERLPPGLQSQVTPILGELALTARVIATTNMDRTSGADESVSEIQPHLFDALSTITFDVPPLAARLDDLPLLAQSFLESCNHGNPKQIGSLRPDTLDLLALHRWPGELDELRSVIAAAHAACTGHEITPSDLPAVVRHAAKAAATPRRSTEKFVLDELLASIEREVITRALAQAGGNKSAAADLLGMTRPRLYRRLVQLGLASESVDEEPQ